MGICALQECVCVCVFSFVSRLGPMPLKWNKDTFMNTPGIPGCDMAPSSPSRVIQPVWGNR